MSPPPWVAEASAYEEAQMPRSSALAAAPRSSPRPSPPIFGPLGVPLTPAGLASLYDGLLPNIVKEGLPLAMYLGIYEYLKAVLLATDLKDSPVVCYLIAGAAGELIGSVLRVPAEAVKSTQQSKEDISLSDAMALNFATAEGRANCVEAWTVAVTRDVPFGAIQIALFEALKIYLSGLSDPRSTATRSWARPSWGLRRRRRRLHQRAHGRRRGAPDQAAGGRRRGGSRGGETGRGRDGEAGVRGGRRGAFFRGSGERVLYWAPRSAYFSPRIAKSGTRCYRERERSLRFARRSVARRT